MDARVLVVDEDAGDRAALSRALAYEGFEVATATDGAAALAALRAGPVDLVLLERLLPDLDGLELCARMRAEGERAPIVILTALDRPGDRVDGLEAGADDYVVKPFSTAELVARVRALLRRTRGRDPAAPRRYADVRLDPATREVRRGERAVPLTPREFDLLTLFLDHPDAVLPRERLLEEAWGFDAALETNSIDVYVGYLRRKLEEAGEPRLIWTVRGAGFVLRRGGDD